MPLTNKRILITAGPTREWLDPVRFISNMSSGQQGYALAESLAAAGAEVILVSGPTALPAPATVTVVDIESAHEMLAAVQATVQESLPVDVAICVAAVSDFRPVQKQDQKIKKEEGGDEMMLPLTKNPDILKYLGHLKEDRPDLVIGFALESQNVVANALTKLSTKKADWVFANEVRAGMGQPETELYFINTSIPENQAAPWPRMTKRATADKITSLIKDHYQQQEAA